MESKTSVTPLDVFLKENGATVRKVLPVDIYERKVSQTANTTNLIVSETAGAEDVLLVWGYSITSKDSLNLTISANNEDVLSTTDKVHTFSEPVLITPYKAFEMKESHATSTMPITVRCFATRYYLKGYVGRSS